MTSKQLKNYWRNSKFGSWRSEPLASSPGHSQILSRSSGESLQATPRFYLAALEKKSFLRSCEIKSGSGLGMRLRPGAIAHINFAFNLHVIARSAHACAYACELASFPESQASTAAIVACSTIDNTVRPYCIIYGSTNNASAQRYSYCKRR